MRTELLAGILVAGTVAAGAAQTGTTAQKSEPKGAKPLTLVGCVNADETNPDQFTFSDAKSGAVYKLSGADAREFVGRRVQIVGGTDDKRVKLKGGLAPSPNAAGQAGAMDPTRAAMIAQGSERGTGGATAAQLPEFNVKSLKPAQGNCPPAKQPGH